MRGVHLGPRLCHSRPAGSSPHARGPLPHPYRLRAGSRIIPACAGSTRRQPDDQGRPEDHPRMRGVHQTRMLSTGRPEGSSPHARGPLFLHPFPDGEGRIIPACAGSTTASRMLNMAKEDHPRMRGVHTKKSPEKCHS